LGIEFGASYEASPPIPLASGDLLALFTDGLTDAMNDFDHRFGAARVEEVLGCHRNQPPQMLLETLFAAVRDFVDGEAIHDDMTAVLAKVTEPAIPHSKIAAESIDHDM
jgi:serine phosphatase RsbU (regulator of sigma subunit)